MTKTIEDFSVKVQMVNPDNGYKYTDHVNLVVEDWNEVALVAYTFNSDSENTAKQLYKALEKYGRLLFVTGVTGRTKNQLIQMAVRDHMVKLYGDKIDYKMNSDSYLFSIVR